MLSGLIIDHTTQLPPYHHSGRRLQVGGGPLKIKVNSVFDWSGVEPVKNYSRNDCWRRYPSHWNTCLPINPFTANRDEVGQGFAQSKLWGAKFVFLCLGRDVWSIGWSVCSELALLLHWLSLGAALTHRQFWSLNNYLRAFGPHHGARVLSTYCAVIDLWIIIEYHRS